MATQAFDQLMERALSDEAFREQLRTDPASVVAEYDLSEDEEQALRSGDAAQVQALGVDQRVSKMIIDGGR